MKQGQPIRVLIAEDSPTARQLLVSIFDGDAGFEVVGQAKNGTEAIEMAIALRPDLISMDVEMPILSGIEATREIMRDAPTPIIIVTATTSSKDVSLALTATQAGALTVVEKPSNPLSPSFDEQRGQLLSMARAMAAVKVVRRVRTGDTGPRPTPPARPAVSAEIRLVAIGTSTGGPAALHQILRELGTSCPVPIVIVQHMAHGFLQGLADWLRANSGVHISLATDGQLLMPGAAYLAPDDAHLGVTADVRATLYRGAAIGGFRPSVDYLFDSGGRAFGGSLLAAILTGMGQDGVEGLRTVKANGGTVLAQDEASSIVFGMAQQAIVGGLVDEVIPLGRIGRRIGEIVRATRR